MLTTKLDHFYAETDILILTKNPFFPSVFSLGLHGNPMTLGCCIKLLYKTVLTDAEMQNL